ncbi:MAG: T9SS type A sorting domain-containing protein [Cyclobacteriaceae bacterium]|nr:T9SS type A sorting domain-containing protein [Cyclobacteriaceae bacterium]
MRIVTLFFYKLCFAFSGLVINILNADAGIRISAEEKYVLTGNLVEVNLLIEGFDEILTAQGSIRWDARLLRYHSSKNFALPFFGLGSLGTTDIGEGILRFLWTPDDVQARSLPPNSVFITLIFETIGEGTSKVLVSGDPLIIEFSDKNLDKVPVESIAAGIHIASQPEDFFEITVQNDFSCREDSSLGSLLVELGIGEGKFEYIWFDDQDQELGRGATLNLLKDGNYSLKVYQSDTFFAGPIQRSIEHTPIILSPVIRSITQNTNCGNGNGSIEVDVKTEPFSDLLKLKGDWFIQSATDKRNVGSGLSLAGLESGIYLFVAREDLSDCQSDTLVIQLKDEPMIPELDFDKVKISPDRTCNPGIIHTGKIDVSEAIIIGEQRVSPRFAWYKNETNSFAATPRIEGLAAGKYTLILTDPMSNCKSDNLEFMVYAASNPEPGLTIVGTIHEDRLKLTIDGKVAAAEWNITWYEGRFPLIDNVLSNDIMLEVEKPTTSTGFSVRFNHISTGCMYWYVYDFDVEGASPELKIESFISANNTACSPFNGQVKDFVLSKSDVEYVIEAYDTAGIMLFSGMEFSSLGGGQYFFIARDKTNQLTSSNPLQVQILDEIILPELEIEYRIKNSRCLPDEQGYSGSIGFSLSGLQNADDAQIIWYTDDWEQLAELNNFLEARHLKDGDYTLEVTDLVSGCMTELAFNIEFEPFEFLFDVQTRPNNFCTNGYNGSAIVVLDEASYPDYRYFWLSGFSNADTSTAIGRNPEILQLMAGNYRLVLQHIASACISKPYSFVVTDHPIYPVAQIVQSEDSLKVNEGIAWEWFLEGRSLGEINGFLVPSKSGNYKVLVMNEYYCTSFSPNFEYSITRLDETGSLIKNVRLYPNPVHEMIHLQFSNYQSGLITLYNITGKSVWVQRFHQEDHLAIPAGNLLPGVYTLRLEGTGGSETLKLIKK